MNQPRTIRQGQTNPFYRPRRRVKFRRPGKNFKPIQGEQLQFDFEPKNLLICDEGIFEAWRPLVTVAVASTAITPGNPITDDDVPF